MLVFSDSKCHDRGSFRRCTLPWLPCSAGRGPSNPHILRRPAMNNYVISVVIGVLVIILLILLILHFA